MPPPFVKELAGAETVFQPDNLDAYADEPWDIRITLGDAPLDDAFYYTVDDPEAVRLPLRTLLEEYALDPARADELDVETYPELPMLQEELRQHYEAGARDQLRLRVYVNKDPSGRSLSLSDTARPYLGVCTFHDGSFDYRVLDLVFVAEPPVLDGYELDRARREYGGVFLLLMMDRARYRDPDRGLAGLLDAPPFRGFIERRLPRDDEFQAVTDVLRRLEIEGMLARTRPGDDDPLPLRITERGETRLRELHAEAEELVRTYDRYRSVSVAPPALGVPDGFDARLQMMAHDGREVVRSLYLYVFLADADDVFGTDWAERFEDGSLFQDIHALLGYRTAFTPAVIERLAALA